VSNILCISDADGVSIAIRTGDVVYVSHAASVVRIQFRHGEPVTVTFDNASLAKDLVKGLADGMQVDR
jgi:hypothetical protein